MAVVLGWMISLSVEPGIEPGTFRISVSSACGFLATPLPSLRSSSTFLLLFLTLLFSLCASPFVPLPTFFLYLVFSASTSRRETDAKKPNSSPEELVGFYSRHSTHNPFPQPIKIPLGGGLLKQRWVFCFSFTYRPTYRHRGVCSFGSDYCPCTPDTNEPSFVESYR